MGVCFWILRPHVDDGDYFIRQGKWMDFLRRFANTVVECDLIK